ncbi:MAG: SDR family oxidoreductase [Pseudobdellovibrionaceae bacterium]
MMGKLENKICLITGAAQGIGLATAQVFIEEGARVLLTDIADDIGKAAVQALGNKASYLHLDVTRPHDWDRACEWIQKKWGRLDILVNAAGVTGHHFYQQNKNPEQTQLDTWEKIQTINHEGVFFGCKLAIGLMKNQQTIGSIVNVASRSLAPDGSFSIALPSVRNHTKSVAHHCAQKGYPIRCNSVHPVGVYSSLWEQLIDKSVDPQKYIESVKENIPIKRLGTASEIAQAILFLASDDCLFMTGSDLVIDGGLLASSSPQLQLQPSAKLNLA